MGKESILAKVKANRTRPAEIEGEPVWVRVHSGKALTRMVKRVQGGKDKDVAGILAKQFLDKNGEQIFTPEWILSDECSNVFIVELSKLFLEVNSGTYKKK